MQVARLRHTWQVECQLVAAFSRHVVYTIFRLSFAVTSAWALLCIFFDDWLSIFAAGVRRRSDCPSLIFGLAWSFGGRMLALMDVCWRLVRWTCYWDLGYSGKGGAR